jgi:hypothetical protein
MAFTCITISGGKSPGPTGSWFFLQPSKTLFEQPFTPFGDDFSACVKSGSDLIVLESISGEQDHLGAQNLKVWQRIL